MHDSKWKILTIAWQETNAQVNDNFHHILITQLFQLTNIPL